MNKKIFIKLVISIVSIVITILTTISLVFAWKIFMDNASQLNLAITKIDSEIYLYQALDSNYNGIPDLLSQYSSSEISEIKANYPLNKREYYQEKYAFNYIGYRYALSSEPSAEEILNFDMDKVYPTQIKTVKFSVLNNSDGTNWLNFKFNEKTYTTQKELDMLKCMSVRCARVINNDNDITSSNITVEYSDKVYFNDYITTKSNGFSVLEDNLAYQVMGSVTKDPQINNDVVDVWFQFEFESFKELKAHESSFSLSESDYNSLEGQSLELPDLKLVLELRITD